MDTVTALLEKNGLVFAFLVVWLLMVASNYASAKLTRGRLQGSAIAIIVGAYVAMLLGCRCECRALQPDTAPKGTMTAVRQKHGGGRA